VERVFIFLLFSPVFEGIGAKKPYSMPITSKKVPQSNTENPWNRFFW